MTPVFRPGRVFSSEDAHYLNLQVDEMLAAGAKNLIVDFCNALFMDSRGLGAIVAAYRRINSAGGHLFVCNMQGQTKMLVEQTDMARLLRVYDTLENCKVAIAAEQVKAKDSQASSADQPPVDVTQINS